MPNKARDVPVNSSPAVAANAEGEEIEVLESTDVLPVAPEDVRTIIDLISLLSSFYPFSFCLAAAQPFGLYLPLLHVLIALYM